MTAGARAIPPTVRCPTCYRVVVTGPVADALDDAQSLRLREVEHELIPAVARAIDGFAQADLELVETLLNFIAHGVRQQEIAL